MKKNVEIIGLTLLIISALLPVAEGLDDNNITSTVGIESVPIIDFENPSILNFGYIPLILINNGNGIAENITWEVKILEGEGLFKGKLFSPKEISGTFPSLNPGQSNSTNLNIKGLGITTIYFGCKYKIKNISGCNVEFQVKQEWKDFGLGSLHLFLPSMQPEKEWMNIENYSYFNETDFLGVELFYEDLLQMHNVRVVQNSDSISPEILFQAACKFYNGTGVLQECGITKDIITSGIAHWEVELVDDE